MTKRLVIAEKPSVGMSIAAVLGVKDRKDGYMEGRDYIVSWGFGHLAELANADRTPLETMAEEAPSNEVAKSARPSVLQKLHSYSATSKTEPKKSKEEIR